MWRDKGRPPTHPTQTTATIHAWQAFVADVADTPTPTGDGWCYDQPLVPCVACGVGTTNRAPSGRPLHLPCPDPELPDDPDRSARH